jgi:hypothetical protein
VIVFYNPLLKVPPASRGNRTSVWFPSRSGGNLKERGKHKLCPRDWYYNPLLKVPPASRGNRTAVWFPSRSGGNLKEGGKTIPKL